MNRINNLIRDLHYASYTSILTQQYNTVKSKVDTVSSKVNDVISDDKPKQIHISDINDNKKDGSGVIIENLKINKDTLEDKTGNGIKIDFKEQIIQVINDTKGLNINDVKQIGGLNDDDSIKISGQGEVTFSEKVKFMKQLDVSGIVNIGGITNLNGGLFVKGIIDGQAKKATNATTAETVTNHTQNKITTMTKLTLAGSRTMAAPTNGSTGQFASILVIQDGSGSRTLTWNAVYEFASDTAPTLTTTASLGDLFTFRYNGAKWLEVGRNQALTLS